MVSADDVQLPDLQVIQRYSLAVRGATAPRADVIAALQADLAWLSGGTRRRAVSAPDAAAPAKTARAPAKPPPRRATVPKVATATRKPAVKKSPVKKSPAKMSGARRA